MPGTKRHRAAGMHYYRKASGQCDASLLETPALDRHGPSLQREALPASGEDRVRSLVEQIANRAVALLGDPARPIELTGLMVSGRQAEIGVGVAGLSDATSLIDCSGKSGRCLDVDVGNAHECQSHSGPTCPTPGAPPSLCPRICSTDHRECAVDAISPDRFHAPRRKRGAGLRPGKRGELLQAIPAAGTRTTADACAAEPDLSLRRLLVMLAERA